MVKKWSNFSRNPSKDLYIKEAKLLKKLVPEVGIEPTWAFGPRDFESENRLFANPLILKAVSLNHLKIQGINLSDPFHSTLPIPIYWC